MAAHPALGELVAQAAIVAGLAPATIALALVLAIARLEFPTERAGVIVSAIAVSATPLQWVTVADLAAGRAATAEVVLVLAPVAAHPAWEVTAAVVADLVAAVCAVVVCAAAGGAGGKHHEHSNSGQLDHFEFVLAKTSRNHRDSYSADHLGADSLNSCRRADDNSGDS